MGYYFSMSALGEALKESPLTTGIGSLPHILPLEAVKLVTQAFDVPFWPQLPNISYKEQMIPQYSEGIPFVREDAQARKVYVRRDNSDDLMRFYESYDEESRIAVSDDYARGLSPFVKEVSNRRFRFLKGHVTGPLTFTLGLTDEEGRSVYFDEEMREICLMALKAKVRWQVDQLAPHAEEVIIFLDEPILSALGSTTYVSVMRDEAVRLLGDAVDAVKAMGAVAGVHCCGRAEWPLLIEAGAEIVSFDAYDFAETLSIYPEDINAFLCGGGVIAWGIVPTTDRIADEDEASLIELFRSVIKGVTEYVPEDAVMGGMLITPSCGTGSRTIEETLKVFELLMRLKEEMSP